MAQLYALLQSQDISRTIIAGVSQDSARVAAVEFSESECARDS